MNGLVLSGRILGANVPYLPPPPLACGCGRIITATVRRERFNRVYATQRNPKWCWAAAGQMILNYHCVPVSQEQIVARIYGELVDLPANLPQILESLSGGALDCSGRQVNIESTDFVLPFDVIDDLGDAENPLLVGLRSPRSGIGHIYVMTGATYSTRCFAPPIFLSAHLHNPWPFTPPEEEMDWNEFMSKLAFFMRVRIRRRLH